MRTPLLATLLLSACDSPEGGCDDFGDPACTGTLTADLAADPPLFRVEGGELAPDELALYRVECGRAVTEYQVWVVESVGDALVAGGVTYGVVPKGGEAVREPEALVPGQIYAAHAFADAQREVAPAWDAWFIHGEASFAPFPVTCP